MSKQLKKAGLLITIFILVAILSVLLAGCEPTKPTTSGGTLKIAHRSDAAALGYPPLFRSPFELIMGRTAMETLGRFDAKGNMVPFLAESWKTDPAAKTITVTLKKGIKFHDGTPFNATAVKWNLDEYTANKRSELAIASVDVIDDYTVRINLKAWDSDAIMHLCYYVGPMASPTAFKTNGKDWAIKNPVGTGPFQFVSWQRDVKQVYKKFPDYWQKGKPYLDGLEWTIITDQTVSLAALQAGEVHVNLNLSRENAKKMESDKKFVVTTTRTGFGSQVTSLWPDSSNANSPFSKLKVRQALSYAIDTKTILDSIYLGYGAVTNQWAAPDLTIYYNNNVKGYPYNPDKAKQLLTEAGYPNGFPMRIISNNDPESVRLSTAYQGFLAKIGINAQVDVMTEAKTSEIYQSLGWQNAIIQRGPRAWDVVTQFSRYVHSTKVMYAGFKKSVMFDRKMDQLIEQAMVAADQASQTALVYQIQKIIIDDLALMTPVMSTKNVGASSAKVHSTSLNEIHMDEWTPENAWIE